MRGAGRAFLTPAVAKARPWFASLLEAYDMVDAGVAAAIARRGASPACASGCAACCMQPIPALPPEILGIRLFAGQLATEATRLRIAENLAASNGRDCPFLHAGRCLVYPVRPMTCRRYVVFSRCCVQGEDPATTRPRDMLESPRSLVLEALRHALPVYETLGCAVPPGAGLDFFLSQTTLLNRLRADAVFAVF